MSSLLGKAVGFAIGKAVSATNKLAEKGIQYMEAQAEKPIIKVQDFSHIISRLQIAQDSLRRDAAEFVKAGGKVVFIPYRDVNVESIVEKVSADAKLGLFTAMNDLSAKQAEAELQKAEELAAKKAEAAHSVASAAVQNLDPNQLAAILTGILNGQNNQAQPIIVQMPAVTPSK